MEAYPAIKNEISRHDLSTEIGLDRAAEYLENSIQKVVDIAIPRRNIYYHSKLW